jgi:hypothetical protein
VDALPVYGLIALNKDPMANGGDPISRGVVHWERAWHWQALQTV